jgi:hypothetical protein
MDRNRELADASNKMLPSEEDVREFSAKVDEVSILIDGLAKGTISPQYVDSKLESGNSALRSTKQARTRMAIHESYEVSFQRRISLLQRTKDQGEARVSASDEDRASREEDLKEKVAELKARMEMKRKARERHERYVSEHEHNAAETDYMKWDLWCPSDEEDEMIASCTPNNAQLKAMEKDIDARHTR